jgi:hypothetical protein
VSIETDFRAALAAHAPLVSLVGQRIALNAIQQGQSVPYVVFTSSREPQLNLLNEVLATRAQIEVQCWGSTAAAAGEVADAVQAALAGEPAVAVLGRATGYDAELSLDATVLTVEWWA